MKPELEFITGTIECHFECKEDMMLSLKTITNDDYNGNNGEQCFIEDQNKISHLESIVNKMYGSFTTKEIIKAVIKDNYSDSYYHDYKYTIIDTIDDNYYVVIATLS